MLEQAFQETYGLELKTVLTDEERVLGSYRRDVSKMIPKATRIAWSLKKDQIVQEQPSMTKDKFLFNLSRASYRKKWGKNYQSPTPGEQFLAFLVKILPKIGPLKVLELRTPTPDTERMFEASFNVTLDRYRMLLNQVRGGLPPLPNDNFDTGDVTGPGKYRLNDEAHAKLLDALAKQNFTGISPETKAELLEFFGHSDATYFTMRKPKQWAKVQKQVRELRQSVPPAEAAQPAIASSSPVQ